LFFLQENELSATYPVQRGYFSNLFIATTSIEAIFKSDDTMILFDLHQFQIKAKKFCPRPALMQIATTAMNKRNIV